MVEGLKRAEIYIQYRIHLTYNYNCNQHYYEHRENNYNISSSSRKKKTRKTCIFKITDNIINTHDLKKKENIFKRKHHLWCTYFHHVGPDRGNSASTWHKNIDWNMSLVPKHCPRLLHCYSIPNRTCCNMYCSECSCA